MTPRLWSWPSMSRTALASTTSDGVIQTWLRWPASVFEAWFVSAAHDDRILAALPGATQAAANAS
jgi:hypothetical protein